MSPEAKANKMRAQGIRQRLRQQLGLCRCCSEKVAPGSVTYCPYHQMIMRDRAREPNRNAYRLKHNIPLDAPLSRRGRPRVTT